MSFRTHAIRGHERSKRRPVMTYMPLHQSERKEVDDCPISNLLLSTTESETSDRVCLVFVPMVESSGSGTCLEQELNPFLCPRVKSGNKKVRSPGPKLKPGKCLARSPYIIEVDELIQRLSHAPASALRLGKLLYLTRRNGVVKLVCGEGRRRKHDNYITRRPSSPQRLEYQWAHSP